MASFSVVWKRSAEKELRSFPKHIVARLVSIAGRLAEDPRPPGSIKLMGAENSYRIRSGDYRLVYTIERESLIVEIVRADNRKDVYR